jgi:hypothetical protein
MPKPPIQQPGIIIGTYRTTQLPIFPLLPLLSRTQKYNIKSRYLLPFKSITVLPQIKESERGWKKIYGS